MKKAIKAVKEHSLSFWDAMLWATASEANVQVLLSEDFQHDRTLDGIRFCNPFEIIDPVGDIFDAGHSSTDA